VSARSAAAAGLALLALLAGCGGDDEGKPIPAAQADALQAQLDGIEGRLDAGSAGACRDVVEGDDTNVKAVQDQIDALPADVDADVRDALQRSFDRLFQLVNDECNRLEGEETSTETTPTETTPPATVTETVPTTPATTPTATATTPSTTESPSTAPGQDGDGSGGAGAPGAGG
jgi:hypothetical protein